MKPRSPIARRPSPRVRRWACKFCPTLNAAGKVKCAGCGVLRGVGRKSASRTADDLWAQLIKSERKCAARGIIGFGNAIGLMHVERFPVETRELASTCDGRLEAAHVVPRRRRTTRWDLLNGRPLCHAHHRYFTDHEKAWRDFIGPEWDRLWTKAQEHWDGTYPIAELRAALADANAALALAAYRATGEK